jgi:hypothetical protein
MCMTVIVRNTASFSVNTWKGLMLEGAEALDTGEP